MQILALGSATHKELFLQYGATHALGERLGRKTFRKLIQVLCCQSKSVSGLSSFYVAFLDLARNVEAMLARAVDVGGDAVRGGDLLMRLQEHVAFLKYNYGHKHLAAPECDGMEEHCCHPALGGGSAPSRTSTGAGSAQRRRAWSPPSRPSSSTCWGTR
jgi:hypothetical protein